MNKEQAIKYLEARYTIEEWFTDGTILSQNGSQIDRLVSQDGEGNSAEISSAKVVGVRHIHRGNMHHPPADETKILCK